VAGVLGIRTALNFSVNGILLRYCRSYIFELRRSFEGFTSHRYVMYDFILDSCYETEPFTCFNFSRLSWPFLMTYSKAKLKSIVGKSAPFSNYSKYEMHQMSTYLYESCYKVSFK